MLSVQAPSHCADKTGRDSASVLGGVREVDLICPIDDGLATRHLVRDLPERWQAVHHLIQDAPQAPHITWLAQLHDLGLTPVVLLQWRRNGKPPVIRGGEGILVGIHQGLGRHIVWRANLRLAVDIDSHLGLDGVGDAEVNQLQSPLHEHEVGRLEVTVYHVPRVYCLYAFEHLLPIVPDEDGIKSGTFLGTLPAFKQGVKVQFSDFHQLDIC